MASDPTLATTYQRYKRDTTTFTTWLGKGKLCFAYASFAYASFAYASFAYASFAYASFAYASFAYAFTDGPSQ
jgi:uncharacterized protein YjbI with pentapeptide repeats